MIDFISVCSNFRSSPRAGSANHISGWIYVISAQFLCPPDILVRTVKWQQRLVKLDPRTHMHDRQSADQGCPTGRQLSTVSEDKETDRQTEGTLISPAASEGYEARYGLGLGRFISRMGFIISWHAGPLCPGRPVTWVTQCRTDARMEQWNIRALFPLLLFPGNEGRERGVPPLAAAPTDRPTQLTHELQARKSNKNLASSRRS